MTFCANVLLGLFLMFQSIELLNGYHYRPPYSWKQPLDNGLSAIQGQEHHTSINKLFGQDRHSQGHQTSHVTTISNGFYPQRDHDNNDNVPFTRNTKQNKQFSGSNQQDDQFNPRNHANSNKHNNSPSQSLFVNRLEDVNITLLYNHTDITTNMRPIIEGDQLTNWGTYTPPSKGFKRETQNQGAGATADDERRAAVKPPPLQWHVGVYSKAFEPYMQICGGTLVTTKTVISAAHCFWTDIEGAVPSSRFAVATGKLYRPWNDSHDIYAQKSEISAVHLPPRYLGAATSFQDDIAVVVLASPFLSSNAVRPVCVVFDEDLESYHLRMGNQGIVLGWGLTAENGPPAQALQYLGMPFVPIEKCVADAQPDFLKYITSDKICAGVTTGKALCRGDSGGGLVFFDRSSSERVPLLFGVASTAPRNANLCNAHARTALTRVLAHRQFLRAHIPDIVEACEDNYQAFIMPHKADLADRSETSTTRRTQPNFVCNCHCNNSSSSKP